MQRTKLIDDVGTRRKARGRYQGAGPYKTRTNAVDKNMAAKAAEIPQFKTLQPDVPKRMRPRVAVRQKRDFSESWAQWWHSNRRHALTAFSMVAVLISSTIAFQSYNANRELQRQLAVLGARTGDSSQYQLEDGEVPSVPTNPVPDEEEVTKEDIERYYVAPHMPRFISIPKFDSKARIMEVGLTNTSNVDTPANIHDTAWYNQSSNISDTEGIMFVVGHVTGPLRNGIFYSLKNLNSGDLVTVEQGDGTTKKFEVLTKESFHIDSVDMNRALHDVDDLPGLQLNLMTCSGAFDSENLSYDHRLLVTTREVL